MSDLEIFMPNSKGLLDLLTPERYTRELEELLNKNLINPVNDFFHRPGKNIRPRLVLLGYWLAHDRELPLRPENEQKILLASAIVEMIHGGSLIVDDIQDGSPTRRNAPSFHCQYGMPLALNAGNWLYFWALHSVKRLELSPEMTMELIEDLLELMGKAHMGQALDLGTKIDELPQDLVSSTCLTSMELKTGTLLSMALRIGMGIAGETKMKKEIFDLGKKIGLALQMFDDVGNFCETSMGDPKKRHEDLYNRRPTWIWAQASGFSMSSYEKFKEAVALLPCEGELLKWSDEHNFHHLLQESIFHYLDGIQSDWQLRWKRSHPQAVELLDELKLILEKAYVKKT